METPFDLIDARESLFQSHPGKHEKRRRGNATNADNKASDHKARRTWMFSQSR